MFRVEIDIFVYISSFGDTD